MPKEGGAMMLMPLRKGRCQLRVLRRGGMIRCDMSHDNEGGSDDLLCDTTLDGACRAGVAVGGR